MIKLNECGIPAQTSTISFVVANFSTKFFVDDVKCILISATPIETCSHSGIKSPIFAA